MRNVTPLNWFKTRSKSVIWKTRGQFSKANWPFQRLLGLLVSWLLVEPGNPFRVIDQWHEIILIIFGWKMCVCECAIRTAIADAQVRKSVTYANELRFRQRNCAKLADALRWRHHNNNFNSNRVELFGNTGEREGELIQIDVVWRLEIGVNLAHNWIGVTWHRSLASSRDRPINSDPPNSKMSLQGNGLTKRIDMAALHYGNSKHLNATDCKTSIQIEPLPPPPPSSHPSHPQFGLGYINLNKLK